MSANSSAVARSALTNGTRFLPGVDGRSSWARRARDLVQQHESDLGGPSELSQAQRSIIRRAATLTVECERLEVRFSESEAVPTQTDLDLYSRLAGQLRRLLESIGLERQARPVMSIDDYSKLIREGS